MRTFDASFFNRICNHPDVRPWLGGEGELDVSAIVLDPQNYALRFEEGGFILHAGPGASFEVHSQFTPEGRRSSFKAMRAGMDFMFTRTNAFQLTTFLPDNNPAAQGLGRVGGFKPWFRREEHICGPGMQARIDIDDWIARTADLEKDGKRFHDALEAAGSHTNHADDPTHERYVGAAYRMFAAGQVVKAELLYNRWAANAGYVPIRVLNDNPLTVDVGNGIATMKDGEITFLEAREAT